MESLASTQASENPTETSVGYVIFGQSIKMHALRHVVRTLELKLFEPAAIPFLRISEIRLAFDGCDAVACAAKAAFIRSLVQQPPAILQFPVGRISEIAPLFEPQSPPPLQGSLFDPHVKVFTKCWGGLHFLGRFLEELQKKKLAASVPERSFQASRSLEELLLYASTPAEKETLDLVIALVRRIECLSDGWSHLNQSGDDTNLKARLTDFVGQISPYCGQTRAGPLNDFCELLRGLGSAGRNFETAVGRLGTMKIATLVRWQSRLDQLR